RVTTNTSLRRDSLDRQPPAPWLPGNSHRGARPQPRPAADHDLLPDRHLIEPAPLTGWQEQLVRRRAFHFEPAPRAHLDRLPVFEPRPVVNGAPRFAVTHVHRCATLD